MNLNKVFQLALAAALPVSAVANNITGPSSSQSPYVVRSQPGVVTVSLLTVGDAVNYKADGVTPYRMVGIPDGLGALDNGDGTFTILMNQEIGDTQGVVREHGFKGSFVSQWTVDKKSLEVLHGEDLIKQLWSWNAASNAYVPGTRALSRLCSADLPEIAAFYNPASGLGYNGRIFMNGEESGTEGRAFAHLLDGNSYELPALGKFSYENSVAHPNTGDRTVVVGLDDSGGGQVYVYVGQKSASTDPVSAAGLNGGVLYGIKASGVAVEDATNGIPSRTAFTAFNLGDVSGVSGATLETMSGTNVTKFQRPEDGAWDPSNPNDFYFVTTASFTGRSRLWRLRFVDAANPALGGTMDMLLDGTEGPKMMDNMTISKRGSVFLQEDVGGNIHLGKIWRYSIANDTVEEVAKHDADRFITGGANFLTIDEEASGMIPMDEILGEGWYLLDVQAHYGLEAELVQGGQLLLLNFAPGREK
jgi:hypothetical protein